MPRTYAIPYQCIDIGLRLIAIGSILGKGIASMICIVLFYMQWLNHKYLRYDPAHGRPHVAIAWVAGRAWVALVIIFVYDRAYGRLRQFLP